MKATIISIYPNERNTNGTPMKKFKIKNQTGEEYRIVAWKEEAMDLLNGFKANDEVMIDFRSVLKEGSDVPTFYLNNIIKCTQLQAVTMQTPAQEKNKFKPVTKSIIEPDNPLHQSIIKYLKVIKNTNYVHMSTDESLFLSCVLKGIEKFGLNTMDKRLRELCQPNPDVRLFPGNLEQVLFDNLQEEKIIN